MNPKIRIKKPKTKKKIKPNIIKENGKEYITRIDENRYPCNNCLEKNQDNCKKDLKHGLKIEFDRPSENCITIDWDSFDFLPE